VVAVHAVDFGEKDLSQGPQIGYDLDGVCTCQGEESVCRPPSWATPPPCDGPDGRDNSAAALFAQISLFNPSDSSTAWTSEIQSGSWSILVRVRDYNGMANDRHVRVALYPSAGLGMDPCLASSTPAWDGTDRWPVTVFALKGGAGGSGAAGGAGGAGGSGAGTAGCGGGASQHGYDVDTPLYEDTGAFVTGGVVVANLPTVDLVVARGSERTVIRLTAGFLTAKIEPTATGDGWVLTQGLLVGRWKVTDFFMMLSHLITPGGQPLCTNNMAYAPIKTLACPMVDIASVLSGPTTPCDAISLAIAFETAPALIGAVDLSPMPASLCSAATNPTNDTCGAH